MDTKQLSSNTSKKDVLSAEKLSEWELTLQISSYNELLEYVSWLKAKVDLLVATGQKCSESNEIILQKISDLFSKEIKSLERAVLLSTAIGQPRTDSNTQ